MAFNVAEFRSQMTGDGARPNLFSVSLTFPSFVDGATDASRKATFMAKAAQLPGSSMGQVPVYYFGREMKFVGNRSFADWTVTIINDEDFTIRNTMERWMNSLNSHAGNIRAANASTPSTYSVDAEITQYGKTGNELKKYKFVGMFPVDLTPIALDWGSNDTIEEFDVTFAYQYWTTIDSTS
jgi:hypothetical protein